jgi:hypothetical protein
VIVIYNIDVNCSLIHSTGVKLFRKPWRKRNMSEQEILDEIKRIEEYVKNCTPEEARQIMRDAGIINPDGTLTDRYK